MDYLSSLSGGPPHNHSFVQGTQLVIGAVLAGYSISNWNSALTAKLAKPEARFVIFFIIFYQNFQGSEVPLLWVVFDALIVTSILQILDRIVFEIDKDSRATVFQ